MLTCALFTCVPIAAVATQLLLLQYLGIFLCEWVVFLGEWIPSQASQQLYKCMVEKRNGRLTLTVLAKTTKWMEGRRHRSSANGTCWAIPNIICSIWNI